MDILEKVQNALREGQLTSNPYLCAEYRSLLSGEYSYQAGLLEEIKIRKPQVWLNIRENFKSDTATERGYALTEDGQLEIKLKSRIKRIEKIMQGLNSLIRLAEGEIHHTY